MWIEKIENTKGIRYKYRERFTNPENGRNLVVSVTLNSNNKRAQKAAADMLYDKFKIKKETPVQKQSAQGQILTFYSLCDEWEEYTRPMIKAGTASVRHGHLNRIKNAVSDSLLLLDFTPDLATRIFYNLYYAEKRSYSYVHSILVTLKGLMKYAVHMNYINDVSDYLSIRLKRRPATPEELAAKQNKFLNREELQDVLQLLHKKQPRISFALEFIALTGLRCGELLALRTQDYNQEKGEISVNGTIVKVAHQGADEQRGTPKNVYSYRVVQLNSRARYILEWFIMENKRRVLWKCGAYQDRDYIFTTARGYPYSISYINNTLRAVFPDQHLSTHMFRHTHISLLAELGVPLKAIMQRVGHHNPNTTLSIYTHVTTAMQDEVIKKLDAISQ